MCGILILSADKFPQQIGLVNLVLKHIRISKHQVISLNLTQIIVQRQWYSVESHTEGKRPRSGPILLRHQWRSLFLIRCADAIDGEHLPAVSGSKAEHPTNISSERLSWWRHQMETFSALLATCAGNSPVPTQRLVTRSFDFFFDLRLNKRLSTQWWGWWFETLSRPLWRHCNVF